MIDDPTELAPAQVKRPIPKAARFAARVAIGQAADEVIAAARDIAARSSAPSLDILRLRLSDFDTATREAGL